MGNIDETGATWDDEIELLEVDDLVLGGVDGPDNRAPKKLARRTRWLKNLLDPIAATLSNAPLVRALLEHGVALNLRAPVVQVQDSSGAPSLIVSGTLFDGDGVVASRHPIMGTSLAPHASPYGVHGMLDVDLYDPAPLVTYASVTPAQHAGTIRLFDSAGTVTTRDVIVPPAPTTQARSYTKRIWNDTGAVVSWRSHSGASATLDTMRPGEIAEYLRGPNTPDWVRVSGPRGMTTVAQGKTATDALFSISSTAYVSHWYETIPNVRVGDVLHVETWQDNEAPAATAGVAGRVQITSSPTVGLGTIYTSTETNVTYSSGVGIPDQHVAAVAGTYYVHLQAKKWNGAHANFNVVRRRICWRQERRAW